jgi:gliding motility-associated peptidyl-prolyl isomerase
MKQLILLFTLVLLASCSQQKARKPISHSEGSFMKESAERNKKLVASEEKVIDSIIKSNPTIKYIASKKGYWYTYESKNEIDTLRPKRGDIAYFDYELKDIKGNLIYSKAELKPQIYTVDKQNIMMGLRDGIKLMHKNEKVTFLFTSNNAYGYHGDNNKISTNESLICSVTLNDFKSSKVTKTTIEKKPESKKIKKDSTLVRPENDPRDKVIITK